MKLNIICIISFWMQAVLKIPIRCLCGGIISLKLQRELKGPLRFTNLLLRPLLPSTYRLFTINPYQLWSSKSVEFTCCMPKMLRSLRKEFVTPVIKNMQLSLCPYHRFILIRILSIDYILLKVSWANVLKFK